VKLRTGLLALGLTAGALYACQALIGIEDDPGLARLPDAPPPADTGPDVDPCPHARPPPKPAGGASDPESTFHFAVRKVFLGGLPDFPNAYDFDGICSCENHDERIPGLPRTSCVQPSEACASGASTDDPEGRDLGGLIAFAAGKSYLPIVARDINKPFEEGRLGFLVRVQGYNETANDTLVQVRVSTSIGVEARADGGPRTGAQACADADSGIRPSWNGAGNAGDRWFGPNNAGAASDGYVTNGTLVVNGSTTSYEIPVGAQTLRQSKSIFVASIGKSTTGRGFVLRGNLVGLVSADNLLSVIGEFPDFLGNPGSRICDSAGGITVGLFKGPLCDARDLLVNSNDPKRPCDALAFVVGIEAEQVAVETQAPCAPFADAGVACDLRCDSIDAGRDSGDAGRD